MTSTFISYSRKDIDFARKIVDALAENEFDTWIDWHSIPKGEDWEQEIYRGIETAETFIFLMSPDSAQSDICNQEIAHAIKNNKRIIPIVIRDTSPKEFVLESSGKEITRRNWIFCRDESSELSNAVKEIIKTVQTDYEWLKFHTMLQVKTLDWKRKDHERSLLLRGQELEEAELKLSATKEPVPTDLQRDFVLRSRQATDRQRRSTFSIAMAGIVALAVLAIFGFVQAGLATEQASIAQTAQANAENESNQRATAQAIAEQNQELAEERARIARAKELAAQSITLQDRNFQNSLLLGVEAFYMLDDAQTRGALLDNIRANPQLRQIYTEHSGPVNCVAFSPDGQILASGSDDGTIILLDMKTGKPVGPPLNGHSGSVHSLAFSPDGRTLVSGGGDEKIMTWDMETRQPTDQPLTGHSSILEVAYSPDGTFIASGGFNGEIIVWDTTTRRPIGKALADETDRLYSLTISPDGKTIVSAGLDIENIVTAVLSPPHATFWNLVTRQPARRPFLQLSKTPDNESGFNEYGLVRHVVFSPNGKILASGTDYGVIILWDVRTGRAIGEPLIAHTAAAALTFSPDGKILASASEDGTVILWDMLTKQPIGKPLRGHSGSVHSVAFSPDDSLIATGGEDGSVILWSVSSAFNTNVVISYPVGESITGVLGSQFSMAFSPDGKTMASGNIFAISFWDMTTHPPDRRSNEGDVIKVGEVHSVSFSPDGKTLASADDRKVTLWDATTRESIKEPFRDHSDTVNSVTFSPDGKILASASDDGTIILRDVAKHQSIGEPIAGHAGPVNSLAFSPDGTTLASGGDDNSVILWNISDSLNPQVTARFSIEETNAGHSGPVNSVVFSPDGRIVASGSDDKLIILWNVATGEPIGHPLVGHIEKITGLAMSPDNILASVSLDKTVILWDLTTGNPIGQPLRGSPQLLYGVAFSPDGKTLVSGGASTTLILWDTDPHSWIEKACQRAGRNFTQAEWQQYFPGEKYRATCSQWTAGK